MSQTIRLDLIRLDGGTQPRVELNEELIETYRVEMGRGDEFPPVVVFHDGNHHWLADGFHRTRARMRTGFAEIAADIRPGSQRDAILYSLSANATHGLRRTNEDKRRAIERMLGDREWRDLADREIARFCATSPTTVGAARKRLQAERQAKREAAKARREEEAASVQVGQMDGGPDEAPTPPSTTRKVKRAGNAYLMKTAPIGRSYKPPTPEELADEKIISLFFHVDRITQTVGHFSGPEEALNLAAKPRKKPGFIGFQPANLHKIADFLKALAAAVEAREGTR